MDDNLPDAGRHEASVGSGMQATDVVHATHALGLGTFCDKSKRCWSSPYHWWYFKDDAGIIVKWLSDRQVYAYQCEHERRTGVYGKKRMCYLLPPENDGLYMFTPKDQYDFEQLLVNQWDSIHAMLAHRFAGQAIQFEGDVEAAVVPSLQFMLQNVKMEMSASEFTQCIVRLLDTKELPLLRAHVQSSTATVIAPVTAPRIVAVAALSPAAAPAMPEAPQIIECIAALKVESMAEGHWHRGKVTANEANFVVYNTEGDNVTRRARFSCAIDKDVVCFELYFLGRRVDFTHRSDLGIVGAVRTTEDARRTLETAAALRCCPGFSRRDDDDPRYMSGFDVVACEAGRVNAGLMRDGKCLKSPLVGALASKSSTGNDDNVTESECLDTSALEVDNVDAVHYATGQHAQFCLVLQQQDGELIFRHPECAMVAGIRGGRCWKCNDRVRTFKRRVESALTRREAGTPPDKAPRCSYLDSPGLAGKRLSRVDSQRHHLATKLRQVAGVQVTDDDQHDRLATLFALTNEEAQAVFPEGSAMRSIWDDQVQNIRQVARHGGKRYGCRYNPVSIKAGLLLSKNVGQAPYDKLCKIFMLPTSRHLREFASFASDDEDGIMSGMLSAMRDKANELKLDHEWGRCGSVCFDAMTIRSGVQFQHHTGRLLGYSCSDKNRDAVLSELANYTSEQLEREANSGGPELAKHWLVFYFTSLGADNFAFPVARFALSKITASFLADAFRHLVVELEVFSFHVVAAVFDGAAENRSFAKLQASIPVSEFIMDVSVAFDTTTKVAMPHPIWGKSYPIFLMSDPPHLIKKVVNALESSNPDNSKTRGLLKLDSTGVKRPLCLKMNEDAWIAFESAGLNSAMGGEGRLKRCKKLTHGHFHKTPFSRMRVPLAAQVLSKTMTHVIDEYCEGDEARTSLFEPLRKLCDLMDDFFDVCNGNRDKNYDNIRRIADSKELGTLHDVMVWFERWRDEVATHEAFGDFSPQDKKDAFLPDACFYDLNSIAKGIFAMSHFYLRKFPNSAIIVQRRLMQDILEHHFSHVRQAAGATSNPDHQQAVRATRAAGTVRFYQGGKGNSSNAPLEISEHAALLKKPKHR